MPHVDTQPERAQHAQRHSVRIIKPRTASRTAVVSLAMAALAAAALLAMWRFWQAEEPEPYRRKLTDVELRWRCAAGHSFRAAGQVEPRECWTCNAPAYPVATYACSLHGPYEAMVRFAQGEEGLPRVSQLRLVGQNWVWAEEGLRCPRCGRKLVRTRKELLEGITRRRASDGD